MSYLIKYNVFEMQMNGLAVYLRQTLSHDILLNDYWPYLKKYHSDRFAECITWLKENYDNTYRFPLIADFRTAWTSTNKVKYYEPEKREDIDLSEYSADILALARKFELPEKKEKQAKKQKELFKGKIKSHEVWSHKKHAWVDRNLMDEIGGNFILPEDHM